MREYWKQAQMKVFELMDDLCDAGGRDLLELVVQEVRGADIGTLAPLS